MAKKKLSKNQRVIATDVFKTLANHFDKEPKAPFGEIVHEALELLAVYAAADGHGLLSALSAK
jgi:hypothetical protein